jgi:hypothetical protein
MTTQMMNDPKAIAFIRSLKAIIVYDGYAQEFENKVRYASGTRDIDNCVESIARHIAEDANLTPSTETLTALSYAFVRHCAEMSILTREE